MKTIIIILAVLLFLFLLSLIKIVFIVEYKNGKFETKLKILFFTINTKKKKVPKKKAEKLEKKRPDFKAIIDIIKKLREILKDLFSLFPKKLLKHIIIEKGHFYFWFNAGRADRTAMGYAAVSTAVFGIYGILQKYVTVKKFDVNIMPEYVYETTAEL